ncbi:hypothetical protein HYT45_01390 [Candidatus Uhrbacteria bacterium]|nr:hypothetical protein [Candidatus Uhrbacteria bacterium]
MGIPKKHLEEVCKAGHGKETCRYLSVGNGEWTCVKFVPEVAMFLDQRVLTGKMRAKGDNCEGRNPTDKGN